MKFETAVSSYLDHLRIDRGLAANSISSYRRDLTKFVSYLHEKSLKYEALTSDDISAFDIWLKSQELAISSRNRSISAVKSFYKYLALEHGFANPAADIGATKVSRKLPKALTVDEVTALIESAKREGDPISLRDYAILELLYSTGGRVSEIVGINISDISVSELNTEQIHVLKLRGKGSKERIVPLGSFAVKAIDGYLTRIRPTLASKNPKTESALFLSARGSRISRQTAWKIVQDAAIATGLHAKVTPHVFRHSYATHLLDGGADIRVVQELLGHASVTTTQIYTLVTIDKVRESYRTSHPRAL